MICKSCKHEFPDGMPFCTNCGEKQESEAPKASLQKLQAEDNNVKVSPNAKNTPEKPQVKTTVSVATDDVIIKYKKKIKLLYCVIAVLVAVIVVLLLGNRECEHIYSEGDCVTPGVCELCGETSGELAEHKVSEWKTVKDATCDEKGIANGICSVCNAEVFQEIEVYSHTAGEWQTLTDEKGIEYNELRCLVCGELLETTQGPSEVEATVVDDTTEAQETQYASSSEVYN